MKLKDVSWRFLEVNFGGLAMKMPGGEERRAEELENLKQKLIRELRKMPEVNFVTDLPGTSKGGYLISPEGGCFPPILVVLNVEPSDLTEVLNVTPPSKCFVILDGSFMLIGIICSSIKSPVGLVVSPDIREKTIKILGKLIKCNVVPPNIAPRSLLVLNGKPDTRNVTDTAWGACLPIGKTVSIQNAMQFVYRRLFIKLIEFYDICQNGDKAQALARGITSEQLQLLRLVRDFQSTSALSFVKRHSLSKQILLKITTLLELQSDHSSVGFELREHGNDLREYLREDTVVCRLFNDLRWEDILDKGKLDPDLILKIIDHARSEMETYGLSSVTLLAAIAGGVIGSFATILLSRL